ncbi:hypothetical protein ACP4OV_017679 [Aristida adscensionis]
MLRWAAAYDERKASGGGRQLGVATELILGMTGILVGILVGFVDWVLAQRGDAAMDTLEIRFPKDKDGLTSPSPEQVNRWLRYAGRRVTKFFDLDIPNAAPADEEVELPPGLGVPARIKLILSQRRLRLPPPPAVRYGALTELELFATRFGEEASGEGRTALGDFVSSCCPSLRKLSVIYCRGLPQLVLRAEALQELHLSGAWDLSTLDVQAPDLRVLRVENCFYDPTEELDDIGKKKLARIKAPRLEEIAMRSYHRRRPVLDVVHGLSTVRRVNGINLDVHGKCCRKTTGVGLWLLENCRGVEHINVWLQHQLAAGVNEDELVDLTSEGAAPFAGVRSMVVIANLADDPRLVASTSSLLRRCPRLKSLEIRSTHFPTTFTDNPVCFCDDSDKWRFDGNIALESLEEVKFIDFIGAAPEMHLVGLLFESSNSTKRISLIMPPQKKKHRRVVFKEAERVCHELMNIPRADMGRWNFWKKKFIWTRNLVEKPVKRSSCS